MLEAIKICFSKYAKFGGRARRAEFWWFTLFLFLASIGATFVDTAILGFGMVEFGPLSSIVSLALLLPAYAVGARRLHDIDRSGWWQLLIVVPIIGLIVLIVWWATPGERRENRFGANPI
jgi:uncharacterized membrane protein YhaH (DUF805 family)